MSQSIGPVLKTVMVTFSLSAGALLFFFLSCERGTVRKTRREGFFNPTKVEYSAQSWKWRDPSTKKRAKNAAISFGAALAYPVVGAFVVWFCAGLRYWAYCGESAAWDSDDRVAMGAIWPLTLVVSLIIYPFMAIINRLF